MPYTAKQASDALDRYLNLGESQKWYIPNTKNRGCLVDLQNGKKIVVFIYPLVHKQDDTKNYFDTRDSGAYERGVAWNYALENGYKYFCLGVNDQVDKYVDYVFSLECGEKTIEKISGTRNGARNGPGNQIIIPNDYIPSNPFERIQNRLGIFIAVVHKDTLFDYIEKYDNRPYLDIDSEHITDLSDNEYERAANVLKDYAIESGYNFEETEEEIKNFYIEFQDRFSPEKLQGIPDNQLLTSLFYSSEPTNDSLCYWLEFNQQSKKYCGSIAGGSAYKFGLFQRKDDGVWVTGSPNKPEELSDEKAIVVAKEIRDVLVRGAEIISAAELDTLEDYEKLDTDLNSSIGKYATIGWIHKYFHVLFPDKLSGFHSSDWQKHVLYALRISPSGKYYARSGQIAKVGRYADWLYRYLFEVFYDKFGGVKKFLRLGTSDSVENYAEEYKRQRVAAIGWRALGELTDYVVGNEINKKAVAEKMQEEYYQNNPQLASRKAGEVVAFYRTDSDSVFVAMDGNRLLALIDEIGAYYYDAGSHMAHKKSGVWHCCFTEEESLPNKSAGHMTSCYELNDEEDLMFLYEKYYYDLSDKDVEIDDDFEERNRQRFRQWFNRLILPEGDSNAGEPYKESSINAYVQVVNSVKIDVDGTEKSLFASTDTDLVQQHIESEQANDSSKGRRVSALKKYRQFLLDEKADEDMSEIIQIDYNTGLEQKYDLNRIVFGAPGTGKSHLLKDETLKLLDNGLGGFERVTFHPDYTYSQFVGTYKPVMDNDGKIAYRFVAGPFMRVYADALRSIRTGNPQRYLLLVEEINRARVAAVFGDVFQLLDRDENGVSEYEIHPSEDVKKYLATELKCKPESFDKIKLPDNMYIWATMNSADQGVFPMDTAFKRRWSFNYIGINKNEENISGIGKIKLAGTDEPVEWNMLRRAINAKMSSAEFKINEDKLMGPFFLSTKIIASDESGMIIDTKNFIDAFKSKVIMYLYEDAVKQKKAEFFKGCDSSKYSSVIDAFDEKGMDIFGPDFKEKFYGK